MEECEICGKKKMGNFPIVSAKQCECYVQYADRYMKYHRSRLGSGDKPQDYVKWASIQERAMWRDILRDRNRKRLEHWIIKLEVTE